MKKFIFLLICAASIAAIVSGRFYWHHKIQSTAAEAKQQMQQPATSSEKGGETTKSASNETNPNLDKLTKNLPEAAAKSIQKAAENGNKLNFLVVSSTEDPDWLDVLQKQLHQAYGSDVFSITSKTYGDKTTADFLNGDSYKTLFDIGDETDMILMTAMIANDQGQVRTEDTLQGMNMLKQSIKSDFEDVTFMLQPPNPMYKHAYYNAHVGELREHAHENDIIYINHWQAWPDPKDEQMRDNLQKDDETPNQQGMKIWGQYLSDYFTGKELS